MDANTCAVCSRGSALEASCPGCGAEYCSSDCRELDVPAHALLCAAFQSPPRPEPDRDSVLAVLLPADADEPKLVRVPLDTFRDDDTSIAFQDVRVSAFFPPDASPESLHEERNRVRGWDTHSMLEAWHVAEPDAPPNACVAALAGQGGATHYPWRGPVVVLAMTRSTGGLVDPGSYRDVTPRDLRDVVDFVVDHGNDAHARAMQAALATLGSQPVVEVIEDEESGHRNDGLEELEDDETHGSSNGAFTFELSG